MTCTIDDDVCSINLALWLNPITKGRVISPQSATTLTAVQTKPICSFEFLKQNLPRIPTELRIQIDCNEQNSKDDSSIRFNRDPDSNEIECSFELLKHGLQRISTELGMQMDYHEQYSKEDSPIRFNLDPDSNVSESILLFVAQLPAKHDLQRISTGLGTQIDFNEQNSKHEPSIRFNLDPDSMKSNAVSTLRNMICMGHQKIG
jgi:hypothetical protein